MSLYGILSTLVHRKSDLAAGDDYNKPEHAVEVGAAEANLVTSAIDGATGYKSHKLLVDLDVPAYLVPSSTPGHSHLYVDKAISGDALFAILDALADAGIVERGYAEASRARGYSALRLPWVRKEAPRPKAKAEVF